MKKKLYFLEVENIENKMLSKMQLTQKEYKRQLSFLQQRVVETTNEEPDNQIQPYIRVYDFDSYTEVVHRFTNCCCDTILTELICKPGWYFND